VITSPKFASLYTTDQQRALAFWTKTVGFTLQTDAPMAPDGDDPTRWIEVVPPDGGTYLVIFPAPDPALIGTMAGVWWSCDDLDVTVADLKAKGVEFPVEPQAAPWDPNARWAQFSDPDGNLFGVSETAA